MPALITKCIFCGRTDLSREHVWPEWSHTYVRKASIQSEFVQRKIRKTPQGRTQVFSRERAADVTTMRLKVVCKNHCNSGWMSRLEARVIRIATPLITGTHAVLDKHNQEILATWIAMKLLTAEFMDPDELSTPSIYRSLLMGRRLPPEIMTIWISRVRDPRWSNTYHRQATTLGWAPIGTLPPLPPNGSLAKNTQAQNFVIGELFVHATTTTVDGLMADTPPALAGSVKRIWPYQAPFLWPLNDGLTDMEVRYIATAFERFTDRLPFAGS